MILYKKDSKGKIRFVEIYSNENRVIQKHGIIDGKVVYNESECIGKNIGKSNETTPERQAELEAQSKLLKKLDEGYYKTIDEANNETVVLPMLAKDFKIEEHKVQYPCFVQKKYDGMRMLAIKKNGIVKLISRKGKEITTLDHIKVQLEVDSIPDNIYDGEAYSLEVGTFQEQMKAIKKESENTQKIDFNIYDVVLNIPYVERLEILKNIFNA